MDDILAFGASACELRALAHELASNARETLRLELKSRATQVYATRGGVPFLGFPVSTRGLRIRRSSWRRFVARLKRAEWEQREGRRSLEDVAASARSMLAHVARADTVGLRRRLLAGRRPLEV